MLRSHEDVAERNSSNERSDCHSLCGHARRNLARAVFLASDLPAEPRARDAVLLSVMGGGHDLGIDGIGGGNAVVNKVAIIGPASVPGADVDYLFAQVRVREGIVDTSPNCGNMLAAVGPFAIEAGLVAAAADRTQVRIHNVNTGKLIDATVSTPWRESDL